MAVPALLCVAILIARDSESVAQGCQAWPALSPAGESRPAAGLHELAAPGQARVGACGEVETAGPPLPVLHLRDAHLDPSLPRIGIRGRIDPADPLPARHRCDRGPEVLDLVRG